MARKGSICGLIVFFVGIAFLVVTFVGALLSFLNPNRVSDFGKLIPAPQGEWGSALKGIGYAVAVGLLLVMGYIAGRVTMYSIKMYKPRPYSEPDEDAPPQPKMVKEAQPSVIAQKASLSAETVVDSASSPEPVKVNPSSTLTDKEAQLIAEAEPERDAEPVGSRGKRKR